MRALTITCLPHDHEVSFLSSPWQFQFFSTLSISTSNLSIHRPKSLPQYLRRQYLPLQFISSTIVIPKSGPQTDNDNNSNLTGGHNWQWELSYRYLGKKLLFGNTPLVFIKPMVLRTAKGKKPSPKAGHNYSAIEATFIAILEDSAWYGTRRMIYNQRRHL